MAPNLQGLKTPHLKTGDPEPAPLPGHIRVYNMRFCPYAERAVIYLARKGVPTQVVNCNLKEKPEFLLKRNALGKVPTLEIDGKVALESLIIPQLLDDLYPESRVLPKDPFETARQKVLADHLGVVGTAFHGLRAAFTDPSVDRVAKREAIYASFDAFEKELKEGTPFLGGSLPSYADYMVWPWLERYYVITHKNEEFGLGLDFDVQAFPSKARWPKLSGWFTAMLERDEIKTVFIPVEKHLAFFAGAIAGSPNYDVDL